MYEDLSPNTRPGERFSQMTRLDDEGAAMLCAQHPNVPGEYLAFLREIGWGEVRGRILMLYSGLLRPSEVFDEQAATRLFGLLLFGDDMAGYCFAFNPAEGWSVVGIDSATGEVEGTARDFATFIRNWVSKS